MDRRIEQLRTRIAELENIIAEYEEESNHRIQQMQQKQRADIEAIRLRAAEDVRKNQISNEAIIDRFQNEMVDLHNRAMNKLREEYDSLEEKVREYRNEYQNCIQQLKTEMDILKHSTQKRLQAEETNAEIEIQRLEKEMQATENTPYDFFCEGKYNIYVNELDEAKALKNCGMFQAAIAIAVSAQMSFQILRNEVKRKLGSWNEIYDRYKFVVENVFDQFQTKENRPDIANGALYDDLLMDFWSEGEFKKKLAEVKEHTDLINRIENEGYIRYLKKNRSLTKEKLMKDTDRMLIVPREQNIMYSFAKSALEKSIERYCFLQELSDYLCDTQNFEEEYLHFEKADDLKIDDSFKAGLKWAGYPADCTEDVREACHLKIVHAGAEYYFSVYPCKKKTCVENVLVWHFENPARANEMGVEAEKKEMLQIVQKIRERLNNRFEVEFAEVALKNSEEEIQGAVVSNKSEFAIDVTEAERRAILRRNR